MDVSIRTGENGTDGRVFIGAGGREFCLDRPGRNDFTRNTTSHFVLGGDNNVDNVVEPERNDPNKLDPIDTADLDKFPMYIRYDRGGVWRIEDVLVQVNPGAGQLNFGALRNGTDHIFLGDTSGAMLFLERL